MTEFPLSVQETYNAWRPAVEAVQAVVTAAMVARHEHKCDSDYYIFCPECRVLWDEKERLAALALPSNIAYWEPEHHDRACWTQPGGMEACAICVESERMEEPSQEAGQRWYAHNLRHKARKHKPMPCTLCPALNAAVSAAEDEARKVYEALHAAADLAHDLAPERQSISFEDRATLWKRDAGICHLCLSPAPFEGWHVEHVVPFVLGGTNNLANLAVSHAGCNLSKSDGWAGSADPARLAAALANYEQARGRAFAGKVFVVDATTGDRTPAREALCAP